MSIVQDILGSILRVGLTWLGRRRLPKTDGTLHLPGLKSPVEIIRDRWGVPHIYAANLPDLFFAQGFVHAQDRLWQMEINRRTATGRLSEILGAVTLDTDRLTRTFGFHRLAEADWEKADDAVCEAVEAYAAGVNVFLDHTGERLPVEFTLLRHRPEPWTPLDSMAWSRLMVWSLSHAWAGEIVRAQLIETVGPERAAELEVQYPERNPITLPQGIAFNRLTPNGLLEAAQGPFLHKGQGSNAWTISGSRTTTGMPFLCNDAHLPLSLPSIWYTNHLVAGEEGELLQATGVSFLGMPTVMVGHNAHIAWGVTLAFTDCEDLFVEKFHPENPHLYEFRGEWREAKRVQEVISVKGQTEPHIEEVLLTHHGPVISDVVGYPEQRIAVQSMALQPGAMVQGALTWNLARGWDDFVEAVRLMDVIQLNVVYADVEGNIGHWLTGRVPVRAKGQGLVPAPGWTGEYEWVGSVPFEEMPHALNPEQGVVVSCNHRPIPDDYAHFLGTVWMNGYRARRIVDILEAKQLLSLDDFRALHVDFHSIPGLEFVARLEGLSSPNPEVQAAIEKLRAWDGSLATDSVGGTLYEVTLYRLVTNLWKPALGPDLFYRAMGKGVHPRVHSGNELGGHSTVTALRLLDDPNSLWVQDAGGKKALLLRSLEEAVNWLKENLGSKMDKWEWGRLHQVTFSHAMSLQPPLGQVFNLGPYPIGGDPDTVCRTAYHLHTPYNLNASGPSYRQITDMADLSRSWMVTAPGQSGQLGSPHYGDLTKLWLEGAYFPMLWTRAQVEGEAKERLRLDLEGKR